MLNENFISELVKPGVLDIQNRYPGFSLDKTLNMVVDNLDVYRLSEISRVEYLVIPAIEKVGDGFRISAELFDVKRMALIARYVRECSCPFEDVVFLILPDLAAKLSKARFTLDKHCPDGMVPMSKATYTMGSAEKYDNNSMVTVNVNAFCIDKYEYPNVLGADPVVEKTWYEAHELCKSKGKRLCTEYEWEHACRGKYNFLYPYGNQYQSGKCNTEGRKAKRAGDFVDCHGKSMIYDMSGNINEWTGSNWDANISNKVIRGGGWFSGQKESRCTLRFSNRQNTRAKPIGFRCCKSIK
jgi:formylglycine-generating enzyme required for sulfatase activity